MTKLSKNHPFILEARRLERLEAQEGVTPELVAGRMKLKMKYTAYFMEYMAAKKKKSEARLGKEKAEKKYQMREYGGESISFMKNRIQEQKRKNRKR